MVHPGSSSRRSFLTSGRQISRSGRLIPPRGFKSELYPLQHKLKYSFGLSFSGDTVNTALATLIMGSTDMDVDPETIQVNPHNTNYEEDLGPLCRQMSIIDKLTLSIKFNMTEWCSPLHETAAGVFTGDDITHITLLWRPIFFSFPEKLNATDDDTGTSVQTLLGLTSDDTNEDVVPLTTNKLPAQGISDLAHPVSTVNAVQVFGDYNQTTNTTMEDHVWDEDLFQNAIRRFTNKGALKACVGRTRFVNLDKKRPWKKFFIRQFVPRAVRRIVDRTYFGIQVHVPLTGDIGQDYHATTPTGAVAHIGVKILCNYHEWNSEHDQDMNP